MPAIRPKDRSILRRLAEQQAEIASLPVHRETILGWKRLNQLQPGKPMVWINEIPWHEMEVDGELGLQAENGLCRWAENELRQTIYQWQHLRGDMVVEPVFYCPLVIHDSGFGLEEAVDIALTDANNDVVSRRYHRQIREAADIEKIRDPVVSCDWEATEANFQALSGIFGDILPVQKRGQPGFWFAPWDMLVTWWGVEEAMLDLVERPDLVHRAMERMLQAWTIRLDQYEAQNLLAYNNTNVRVGSGGLGYTDELPQAGSDPDRVRARDLWGCATAQIFSAVSPRMHVEFALQYERRWLERFGLTYYGCCEPLDAKVKILESLPGLRKISMSPWVDVQRAIRSVGDRFVFSYKPSPAIFSEDAWNPGKVRRELAGMLEAARGCIVEVIMKDISTVRYQPSRLWEWAQIAAEVTAAEGEKR